MSGASSAGKGSKKGSSKAKGGYKAKFVNYNLTQEDKERLGALKLDDATLLDWMADRAAEGYKVSLRADKDEGHFTASMYDGDDASGFFEYSLTARGKAARNALKALFYKHEHIFERVWISDALADEEYG